MIIQIPTHWHGIVECFMVGLALGLNTLRPRQNGRHFADDTFKHIFFNENVRISIEISLKFVPKGPINSIPALVQIMAWRRPGDKPLSEPVSVSLLTHICVTRPQWVKITCWIILHTYRQMNCHNMCRTVTWIYVSKNGSHIYIYMYWYYKSAFKANIHICELNFPWSSNTCYINVNWVSEMKLYKEYLCKSSLCRSKVFPFDYAWTRRIVCSRGIDKYLMACLLSKLLRVESKHGAICILMKFMPFRQSKPLGWRL